MASHALSQSSSTERRLTLIFLIAATVVAVIAAFGPLWMVRVGLAIVVLGCAASVWMAFKEIARLEALHRTELKALRDQQALVARAHHEESMNLIDTFTARYRAHGEQLAALRNELAERQQQLSTLRGNVVSAEAENERRAARIAELEAQLNARADEMVVLETRLAELAAEGGEVLNLPRRGAASKPSRALPTATELWSDGNHPTVVNMAALDIPFAFERKHA